MSPLGLPMANLQPLSVVLKSGQHMTVQELIERTLGPIESYLRGVQ